VTGKTLYSILHRIMDLTGIYEIKQFAKKSSKNPVIIAVKDDESFEKL